MYMLRCSNGEYYTGSTNNLEKRLEQHHNGEGSNFSSKFLPVKLVYQEEHPNIGDAFRREKQIQKWSRKKKEALIKGDFDRLKLLSKNHSEFKKTGFRKIDNGIDPNPSTEC